MTVSPEQVMASSSLDKPVEALDVRCDGSETVVAHRTVAAGTNGVRVHVSGPGTGAGRNLAYTSSVPGSAETVAGGVPVPADGSVTLVLPAGPAQVACQNGGADPTEPQHVTVVDPNRLYTDHGPLQDKLACHQPGQASSALDGRGPTATAAASQFAGLVNAQLGERGSGYPDQTPQEFIATRNGKATGTIQAFRTGNTWTAAWNWVCP